MQLSPNFLSGLTGSGIGLETSLVFAAEGAAVVCADINEQGAQRTVELIKKRDSSAKAIAVKCDVSKEADVVAMVKKTVEWGGRLDVMFNK